MLKKLGMILLIVSIGTLLSSCLVKQKKVTKIARTTNYLHVYQTGQYIEYDVVANISSSGAPLTTSYGTLRVEWNSPAILEDPITTGNSYPVLTETTTLTYNGNTDPDATVVRYISQVNTTPASTDQGTITLYAIDDGTVPLYWLYDPDTTGVLSSPVITPVIFDSPMAVGVPPPNTSPTSPVDFSVMEGCASGTCTSEIYKFSDSFTVEGDTREITTGIGTFSNPFQLSFTGGVIPKGAPALSVLGDIRDACGTSSDQVSHSGEMYVLPEIGIIKFTNFCILGGDTANYTATLSATNIPLP